MKKLPKKSRISGLYLYCNKCKLWYSNESKIKCKCELKVYRAKIHIPGTKNSYVIKNMEAISFEDVVTEFIEFKKYLVSTNFNNPNDIVPHTEPVLLIDCMAEYMAYLNNVGVPIHKQKTRTIGHIKDYERNFKYYIKALVESGVVVNTLKFLEVKDIHIGYLHKFILEKLKAKNRYYNNIISALRIFTSYIIEKYKYQTTYSNPFEDVQRRYVKYEPKSVTSSDFQTLLSVVNADNGIKILGTGERKNLFRDWIVDAFWLGLFTGGRKDEVVFLKWSDIIYDENGELSHFNMKDFKFNRSHSNIMSENDCKIKQFMIFSDFKAFLMRLGHEHYKGTEKYVLAPESGLKRETMADLISKAFTHFLSKTNINKKLVFKNLRKTFSTAVRMQFGEQAHYITAHSGTAIMDKHYVDKMDVQVKMKNEFRIFEKP
ncbi:MAG: hypothetical protein V4565_08960 [Bacteroidota bacterium]